MSESSADLLRRAVTLVRDEDYRPDGRPIGALIADWLEYVAASCDEADRYVRAGLGMRNETEGERRAVAVARAILREDGDDA